MPETQKILRESALNQRFWCTHFVVTGNRGANNEGRTLCRDLRTPPVRFVYFCSESGWASISIPDDPARCRYLTLSGAFPCQECRTIVKSNTGDLSVLRDLAEPMHDDPAR